MNTSLQFLSYRNACLQFFQIIKILIISSSTILIFSSDSGYSKEIRILENSVPKTGVDVKWYKNRIYHVREIECKVIIQTSKSRISLTTQ